MHVDPLLPVLAAASLAIFVVGYALRRVRQPHIIGYLLTGIVLGPHAMGLLEDTETVARVGGLGVVLLLFFVGMEVSPHRLIANWKVSVLGTAMQIAASVGGVWAIGAWLDWPLNRIVLLGFVISLSSTAVVIRLLQDSGRLEGTLGENVVGILLIQDIAIIPMLIGVGLLSGQSPSVAIIVRQGFGTIAIVSILVIVARRGTIKLGLDRLAGTDRELQVFVSLIICLGLATCTGFLDLSTALGAFVGGILIAAAKETHWIHDALGPFRVVFVATFFASVGMLLDLEFVLRNWGLVAAMTALVFFTNTFINAVILRCFDMSWADSISGGTLLAPIGELSFVLASVGAGSGIIGGYAYQATIATITSTLLLGPLWTSVISRAATRTPSPG